MKPKANTYYEDSTKSAKIRNEEVIRNIIVKLPLTEGKYFCWSKLNDK